MGFPAMSAKGFPGKRVEAYLAGIIPINFILRLFIYLFTISLFFLH